MRTLPVLFHLLWKRLLLADLTLALSDRTLVHAAVGAEVPADVVPPR